MREIEGYRFDETGLYLSETGARLGAWRELARIGAAAAWDGVRWDYTLSFVFAEGSSVTVPVPSSWRGRPQLAELMDLLQKAVRQAPAAVELTTQAGLVLRWGQCSEEDNERLRATRKNEPEVRRLLDAAGWRWVRLEHREAVRLAQAATQRAPDDVEAWKLLLLIEVERNAIVARVRRLCDAVLARAPHDREAQAIAEAYAAREDTPLAKAILRRLPMAAALVVAVGVVSFAGWVKWEEKRERERAWERAREKLAKQNEVVRPEPLVRAEWQAEFGNPHGMMTLAEFHEKGMHGLTADPEAAYASRLEAAEAGHVPAMTMVGRALLRGEGVEKDVKEAQVWLTKAAEARSGEAAYLLGDLFFFAKDVPQDYKASYRWYARAFELGHPEARGQLAYHYERGLGTKQNFASALALYRVMADRGDGWAAGKVGYLLATGQGAERDEAEGLRWYRIGANRGDPNAQLNFAHALKAGLGVERNDAEAMVWLEKAVEGGEPTAGALYADLLWRGDGVKQDKAEALARAEVLAAKGSAAARTLLGKFLVASGPQQDLVRARKLFDEGSAEGSSADQAYHGLLCLEGIGGPRDIEAAMADLELASKDGQQSAALFLAGAKMGYGRTSAKPDISAARRAVQAIIGEPGADIAPYLKGLDEGGNLATMLAGKTEAVARSLLEEHTLAGEALPTERAPVPLSQAHPSYPLAGRLLEIEGEVLVEFIVNPAGRVENAHAVRSSLPLFDTAAISAVQQWRFKPGVKAGSAVRTKMQVPIVFSLTDEPKVTGVRLNMEKRADAR